MKTDALIDLLARGAGAAPRRLALRRLAPAAMLGLLLSAAAVIAWLGPLPAAAFATPAPWVKLAYTGALGVAACWWVARASVPVARTWAPRCAVGCVVLAMAVLAVAVLSLAPTRGDRMQALMGQTAMQCPWSVLACSLAPLALLLWAMRGLAPTRPRVAGLAAGLTAGALGALGYSLACPEASAAFVAVWYTAGIALAALLGAWLGPRVLRW